MADDEATKMMVASLREQIVERVKGQQQLVVLSAAVAGATISFASDVLSGHPEVMALLCLLYVGLCLAVLRHDQEIAIIAQHLLDPKAYGSDAEAQARWEVHKFNEMQGDVARLVNSGAQTAGNYGVPFLAVIATGAATIISGPNAIADVVLVVAAAFLALFFFGAADNVRRYRALGTSSRTLLEHSNTKSEVDRLGSS
jgi:hypothetical protein